RSARRRRLDMVGERRSSATPPVFQGRMRALPLLGQGPAGAVTDGFDEGVEGFIEVHLAGFDEDEPSRRASEEGEARVDPAHGARPANLRMAAARKPARLQARLRIK